MSMTSFVILVALVMVFALIYIELGGLPGKTARERGHPQADAISVLGWLGLLLGVLPWLIAMVWSRMHPLQMPIAAELKSTMIEDDKEAS